MREHGAQGQVGNLENELAEINWRKPMSDDEGVREVVIPAPPIGEFGSSVVGLLRFFVG